jgi:SAM-dependent methyltransferase
MADSQTDNVRKLFISSTSWVGFRFLALSNRFKTRPNLMGDRELEWIYASARLGRYCQPGQRVLDFGCGIGILSLSAADLGAKVIAIDLLEQYTNYRHQNIEFRRMDVMELDETAEKFDLIINCSTVEHVGLLGRYNSIERPDGDLSAMKKMAGLLKPGGFMILTIPMGQDTVIGSMHRVYGPQRFPLLIQGYHVVEEEYWRKNKSNVWEPGSQDDIYKEIGSDHYYGLGLMVLQTVSDKLDRI